MARKVYYVRIEAEVGKADWDAGYDALVAQGLGAALDSVADVAAWWLDEDRKHRYMRTPAQKARRNALDRARYARRKLERGERVREYRRWLED